MRSPGSETSSDTSTDASSADSASDEAASLQGQQRAIAITTTSANNITNGNHDEDSDSDSDISMSAHSDDEEEPPSNPIGIEVLLVPNQAGQNTRVEAQISELGISRKRRLSSSTEIAMDLPHNGTSNKDRKRLRTTDEIIQNRPMSNSETRKDKSLLPAEIWHHIFTFCPPRVLGKLLRVNKSFNSYTGSFANNPIVALPKSCLKLLSPDEIWRASRKRFLPGAPRPLLGRTELDMWKLACGTHCHFCNKKNQIDARSAKDQWHPGPGANGVAPIWSFGFRACGPCLKDNSIKEIDLLLSSIVPSPLMAALPLVLLTNELHVIPVVVLQAAQHPPSLQITKHFSNQQVDDIKKEFEDVKALGSATAEEWLKGLDGLGKKRRNDATRWERWEAGGGLTKMCDAGVQEPQMMKTEKPASIPPKPIGLPSGNGLPPHQPPKLTTQPTQFSQYHDPPMPLQMQSNFLPPSHQFDALSQQSLQQFLPQAHAQPKLARTKEEVTELKAARRLEIERRCMLLDPPLTASVLAQMASFQAAIQIIQPLTDGAWEVLKPRLLSQREEAEQRETDRIAQTRVVQERFDERRHQDIQARSESKDVVDREWEDVLVPLRARIGGYADEIIRDGWNGGEKVTATSCSLFAAEVLIYVRKRFYAEFAKDDAALRAAGKQPELDPPNGPYTRKLILENMKWVFDTKIKPLTEPHRKELFLCNDCEFVTKYYGFEGIIQHYAAKHTSALSKGSIVVHWKSEWPQHPPFNPDPNSIKPYYNAAPGVGLPYTNPVPQAVQQSYGYAGYQPAPNVQVPPPHVYQQSPGPYYGHAQFDPYSGHQNGPFAPPQYPDVSQSYQTQQYPSAAPQVNGGYEAHTDYSQQGYSASYATTVQDSYAASQSQGNPPSNYDAALHSGYVASNDQYGQPYNQPASHPATSYETIAPQITEKYKTQLSQLARDARDVWDCINGVKEVPGSVKVYTVIYHLLSRFRDIFQEDPSLSMVVAGLSSNKDMRPVRNVNGLVCKACSLGLPGSISAPTKKHYSFPQLVNHFYSAHEEGVSQSGAAPIPDWTKDMVELPEHSKLVSVASAPGMDDEKLKLFVEALPLIVAPLVVAPSYRSSDQQRYEIEQGPTYVDLAPSQDNHASYYATGDNSSASEIVNNPHDDGEYDPRNPRDPIVDSQSFRKPSTGKGYSREHEIAIGGQPAYRFARQEEEPRRVFYQERPDGTFLEKRPMPSPPQTRYVADYGRPAARDEAPIYVERPVRYRDEAEVEYRLRDRSVAYEGSQSVYEVREGRAENNEAFRYNRRDFQPLSSHETFRPAERLSATEGPASQQSRIFDVVAQIQEQAKVAQDRQHARKEQAGSEEGEVPADSGQILAGIPRPLSDEGGNAAQRFLDEFRPAAHVTNSNVQIEEVERLRESSRSRWESGRGIRKDYEDDLPIHGSNGRYITREANPQNRHMYEQAPSRQSRAYAYDDRYVSSVPDQRERSPELVDRRYKLSNVVYQDERPNSATRRTPSRYARYESVRLGLDRERSRTPVYVKMGPGPQPGQYREREREHSPGAQDAIDAHGPVYRTRSPLPTSSKDPVYERAPPPHHQPEYYRVEPRPREQFEESFEYVRVADPQGDYMIRRAVRRPVEYARYEDDGYARQLPVYETRAPPGRQEQFVVEGYEEEYDPRHPETGVSANVGVPVQRIRYQ